MYRFGEDYYKEKGRKKRVNLNFTFVERIIVNEIKKKLNKLNKIIDFACFYYTIPIY